MGHIFHQLAGTCLRSRDIFRILKHVLGMNLVMFFGIPSRETNIAPEHLWLGDYFPFRKAHFQGRTVSFGEGTTWKIIG